MGNFLFRRRVSWLTGILTLVVALSGCLGGGGSTYQVTVVVEEGGNPLPGVEVSYSGTVSGAGGVTDDLGQVRIASLEGEIEIHFLLEGYTFDPHPLLVNGSGTYTVNAEALPPEQVATPLITLSESNAQNREPGLTFTVEAVEGVSFYYTLDGSDPTEESSKYEGEVSLTAPDTDQEALLVIKVIGVRAGWSNSEVASASVTYQQEYFRFFEDFESYSEGEYPDSFFMRYDGTGGSNQKVISTESWDGSGGKVFRLEGAGSWASEQLVSLPDPLTEFIVVKAWVKPKRGSWPGRIGLYNQTVGTWGTRVSGVLFEGGKIKAMLDGADNSKIELSEYEEDRWYKVTMVHDLQSKTYDIYLDGVQVAADLGLHPTVDPTFLNLTAGNTGVNEIYFDDVEITFAFVGL